MEPLESCFGTRFAAGDRWNRWSPLHWSSSWSRRSPQGHEVSESRLSELMMARGVRLAMDQRDPSSYLMPRVLSLRAYASYSDVNK